MNLNTSRPSAETGKAIVYVEASDAMGRLRRGSKSEMEQLLKNDGKLIEREEYNGLVQGSFLLQVNRQSNLDSFDPEAQTS